MKNFSAIVFKPTLFLLIFCLSGCGAPNDAISPPFFHQFRQGDAGVVLDMVVNVKKHDVYYFSVGFKFDGSDGEYRADLREKIAGDVKKQLPRTPTPFILTISSIEENKETEIYRTESDPELTSWNGDSFSKKIGGCYLSPGIYRFKLVSQRAVSELFTEKVGLSVGADPKATFNKKNIDRIKPCQH